jgi:CheY-like chemotaxis protein
VLIIDDEPDAQQLFQRMLSTAEPPCRVLRASNGRQALRILREERPDAILLDLVMPDMDGFRFLETRRNDPQLHAIPVVVISARDPTGHPIVSPSLALTRAGGLSVAQVLACIEALCAIAGPAGRVRAPKPPETHSG